MSRSRDPAVAARNDEIIRKFRDGALIAELSAEHGISGRTVYDIVYAFQITLEPDEQKAFRRKSEARRFQKTEKTERNVRMAGEYLAGATLEDLSGKYGLLPGSITQILRGLGVRTGADRAILSDPTYPERALRVAAKLAGANVGQLVSEWRAPRELVLARYAVMAGLHKRGLSTSRIGARLGGRDHSTVVHGLKQVKLLASRSSQFAHMLEQVDAA